MTSYMPQDLADDWEFNILRSAYGAFNDPERLREILDEEARAGWKLVEKFDHQRIRLKRQTGMKDNDALLDFDAYRTTLNEPMPQRVKKTLLVMLVFFVLLFGVALSVAILFNN